MINLDSIDIKDLKLIHLIGERKNLTRVAELIFISQPAVSHRVKYIEESLKKKVVKKIGKQIYLTEVGMVLADLYLRVKSDYKETQNLLQDMEKELKGELLIGTSDTIGIHFLPKYIKEFTDTYPKVSIRLTSKPSRIVSDEMITGKIDLGIALSSSFDTRFQMTKLMNRKDCIIVSADSAFSNLNDAYLKEFKKLPFITLDKLSQSRYFLVEWFEKLNINIRISMELGSIEMVKKYVELGFGFSIVPEFSIGTEVQEGRLHKINILDEVKFQEIGVFVLRNKYLSVASTKFIEFLKNKISLS
jgi:LysR family transcriptional regulator, transcriptional activator of the cysJI operon